MSRTRRLVLMPLLAVGIGVLVGMVGLGVTLLLAGRVDTDRATMADLGVVVVGLVVSVGAGVVAWLVVLARASARLFPARRRLAPVVWSAAAVLGLTILWNALAGQLGAGAGPDPAAADALLWVGGLLVLAAPSAVFVLWDRRERMGRRPGPPAGWPLPPR